MSALADRLPRATLQILPGAAHMTPFTDPAALAQLILRGADRLAGWAPAPAKPGPPIQTGILSPHRTQTGIAPSGR